MFIFVEIENYISSRSGITTLQVIEFLTKVWSSRKLRSNQKYDAIIKYFSKHLISKLNDVEFNEIQQFLNLSHPTGSVSVESKNDLVKLITKEVKKSPNPQNIKVALEISSLESLRDFFKSNLQIYMKLFKTILMSFGSMKDDVEELKSIIVEKMFLLSKVEGYDELFLEELLIPLHNVFGDETTHHELLRNIFFHKVGSTGADISVFDKEMSQERKSILLVNFIGIHKTKLDEIAKLLQHLDDSVFDEMEDDEEFLRQIGTFYGLVLKNEIEFPSLKKYNSALFDDLSEKITTVLEISRESMELMEFLDILCCFINCDPFLLEKNLYTIIIDCMFKEKSNDEQKSFEKLMVIVLKIYGKDLGQFLLKFLKVLQEKLENFQLPKKKKRKLKSESEGTPKKKQKINETLSKALIDENEKQKFWPELVISEFNDIVAGLNVAQTTKILKTLNKFLIKDLKVLEESSSTNENSLYKIDLVSNLLCSIFEHTRIMEQLMGKTVEIVSEVEHINVTLKLFSKVILSIEYNSRLVINYLSLLRCYDSFLMLFYYHFDKDIDQDFDPIFKDNQLNRQNEWEIIQQRVKNFGKIDELNNLNLLIIQQKEKSEIFDDLSSKIDFTSIITEEAQIEFVIKRPDLRSFFINSLKGKQIEIFTEFLVRNGDEKLEEISIQIIAKNQNLLEEFIKALVKYPENNEKLLKIIKSLPLWCTSDDCKKSILEKLLKSKTDALTFSEILEKIFKNDGYKGLFRDFKIEDIIKTINVDNNRKIIQMILTNTAKKMNGATLENFNWIVAKGSAELSLVLAQIVSEINLTPGSGATAESINEFKTKLIEKVLKLEDNFEFFAKIATDNFSSLNEDLKTRYSKALQKFINKVCNLIRVYENILKII